MSAKCKRKDMDGDGVAELRKVCVAGKWLLATSK